MVKPIIALPSEIHLTLLCPLTSRQPNRLGGVSALHTTHTFYVCTCVCTERYMYHTLQCGVMKGDIHYRNIFLYGNWKYITFLVMKTMYSSLLDFFSK
jgi:hypothetical protein